MRKYITAFVVVVSLVGCGQPETRQETETRLKSAAPLTLTTDTLVGRWQFVLTDEVRASYRAKIAARIEDPVELEKTLKYADEEAHASELEFTSDDHFISRVLGEELVRDGYVPHVASPDTIVLEHGEKKMEIVFVDHDTISLYEPGKGHLIYTRVK